ncbi:MAG: redoxin domain-containing protein [Desulfopila sp.]
MRKIALLLLLSLLPAESLAESVTLAKPFSALIYNPGQLQATDSTLKVAPGELAPDFALPSIRGGTVTLSDYRGKHNVVLSFVPAAWTPVCSAQWPGYNISQTYFSANDAVLIGITVDNVAALHAWTTEMGGLWFEVLSDFWPHGRVADSYGLLRGDGMAERALVFIDKHGVIAAIEVSDINTRPPLKTLVTGLQGLSSGRR